MSSCSALSAWARPSSPRRLATSPAGADSKCTSRPRTRCCDACGRAGSITRAKRSLLSSVPSTAHHRRLRTRADVARGEPRRLPTLRGANRPRIDGGYEQPRHGRLARDPSMMCCLRRVQSTTSRMRPSISSSRASLTAASSNLSCASTILRLRLRCPNRSTRSGVANASSAEQSPRTDRRCGRRSSLRLLEVRRPDARDVCGQLSDGRASRYRLTNAALRSSR